VKIDGAPKLLDGTVPQESDLLQLLDFYRPQLEISKSTIVGSTKVFLKGSCRLQECNLGNFIADGLVDYAALYKGEDFWKADVAIGLMNGGGVRTSIDHKQRNGNISYTDAAMVLPFGNNIVIIEVTGKDLMAALEHSVFRYDPKESYGEFLQFSGVKVVYNVGKPPGSRVVDAQALCAKCLKPTFKKINETEKYKIVTNSYLAGGGDNYKMLKNKQIKDFQESDLNVFIAYLKKKSPINPAVENRIRFSSKPRICRKFIKMKH
jgi:2',3'-cyclic-nucleotide 2'-phosphodiesterase (5'-nucleotidase family)